jgi:hypothetical protein
MNYIEHNPPTSRLSLNIERIQNWCNVIYYPLEHIYWLGAHNVIPLSEEKTNRISIWSCRFWAAYVMLEFARLADQWMQLKQRETNLIKRVKDGEVLNMSERHQEVAEIKSQRKSLLVNTIINTG